MGRSERPFHENYVRTGKALAPLFAISGVKVARTAKRKSSNALRLMLHTRSRSVATYYCSRPASDTGDASNLPAPLEEPLE